MVGGQGFAPHLAIIGSPPISPLLDLHLAPFAVADALGSAGAVAGVQGAMLGGVLGFEMGGAAAAVLPVAAVGLAKQGLATIALAGRQDAQGALLAQGGAVGPAGMDRQPSDRAEGSGGAFGHGPGQTGQGRAAGGTHGEIIGRWAGGG